MGTTKEIMNLAGKETSVWVPEEKLTVAEAVHGYTVQGAYASGEEQIKVQSSRGSWLISSSFPTTPLRSIRSTFSMPKSI